jgi:hypothetical protein
MAKGKQQQQSQKATPMPISQAIRQAGTGGITKQELKTITQDSGKSSGAVVQKLDKINQNIKKNGGVGINLNSGAANMLIREASRATPAFGSIFGGPSPFGTGRIGQTLQGMIGSRASGGYINPISGQQSRTAAVSPTLLARGMDLMPSGRQTVRGIGPQYTGGASGAGPYNATNMPITKPTPGVGPGPWAPTQSTIIPKEEVIPAEEPMTPEDMAAASAAASADGRFDSAVFGNWAPGFKAARSGRKRAGRNAQGLGSMRNAPKTNTLGY